MFMKEIFFWIAFCFTFCKSQNNGDRIIGGASADITQFPYQISLTEISLITKQREHICGGSILSPNIVVTAAHCTQGPPAIKESFQVRAGSTSSLSGGQLIAVSQIIDHEQYEFSIYNNDISILILAQNLVYSPSVQPIPIATTARTAGAMCVVSGWGIVSDRAVTASPTLNFVQVPLISKSVCESKFYSGLTASMICAGYPQGAKDSCKMDSGGPLAQDGELVGIVSWGMGCAEENHPGVYTDVLYMSPWINEKLKKYSV